VNYGKKPKLTKERLQNSVKRLKIRIGIIIQTVQFPDNMRSKREYIDNLKDLVAEYLTENNKNSNRRPKRGVLNFVGQISKILFETLTQADARNYNKQIIKL
jgi:hypothetical protein